MRRYGPLTATDLLCLIATLIVVCVGLYGSQLGLGEDPDSELVYEVGAQIIRGEFVPSRNLGLPLYEIPISFISHHISVSAANLVSLGYTLLFLLVCHRLLRSAKHGGLIFCTIALSPLVLINSSIIMETAQGLFFFAASIYLLQQYVDVRSNKILGLLWLTLYCSVMTRPDYIIVAAAAGAVLFVNSSSQPKELMKFGLLWSVGLLCVYLSYYGIYGVHPSLGGELSGDSFARRVLRASVGVVNLVTPIGALLIGAMVFLERRSVVAGIRQLPRQPVITQLFVAMSPLYLLRFLLLPDELEYILPLFVAFLLFLAHASMSSRVLMGLSGAIVSLNLVHISFFQRTREGLKPEIAFNEGALVQDLKTRQFKEISRSEDFGGFLLDNVKHHCPDCTDKSVTYSIFGAGYVTDQDNNITDQFNAHVINSDRHNSDYQSTGWSMICDEPVRTHRGWRLMQPRKDYAATLDGYTQKRWLTCTLEDS